MAINQIWVVDNLVESIKLRGLPPSSQNTFTSDGYIQILSEEMQSHIVPIIDSISEEYFVTNVDLTYDPTVNSYDLPSRAVGGKLRDVVFVDSSGNEINIPRLRPEDIKTRSQFIRYQPAPWGFYLRGNKCILFLGANLQNQPAYPILRLKIIRRPNILTSQANCGQILNIIGNTVTLSYADPSWTTTNIFDIIQNEPGFSSKGDDLTVSGIAGFDITFNSLPSSVIVGDWVALANYSPIPQIPVEGHFVLAQYATAKILEALGDTMGMQAALAKAEQLRERFLQILTPRVEGSVIKLVSRGGVNEFMDNSGYY